jgi:hypothetical protein
LNSLQSPTWPKMAILNPDHLIEQAEKLIAPPPKGPPRQADLRRAISATYYAVFHMVLSSLADDFVGTGHRQTARYGLVYRSVQHGWLTDLCDELSKNTPRAKFRQYLPSGGFDPDFKAFASSMNELKHRRHAADYDPLARFKTADSRLVIGMGKAAMRRYRNVPMEQRKAFLTMLLLLKSTNS